MFSHTGSMHFPSLLFHAGEGKPLRPLTQQDSPKRTEESRPHASAVHPQTPGTLLRP